MILAIPARWTRGRRSVALGDCGEAQEERGGGGLRRLVGQSSRRAWVIASRHKLRNRSLAEFFRT